MKLLVVTAGLECTTLDPVGGWLHELTTRLSARGHRVTVLCTRAADAADSVEDPPGVTVWRPAEADLRAALTGLLELGPDVVHVAAPGPLPAEVTETLARAPLLIDLLDWSALCPAGDLLARPRGEECAQHHPVAPCGSCAGHVHVRAMEPFIAMARAGHRAVAHASHVRDRSTFALGRGVSLVPVGVDAVRFSPEPPDLASPGPPLAPEVAAIVGERGARQSRVRPRVITLGPPTPARGGPRLLDLLVALHARVPGVELVVPGTDPDNPDLMHIHLAEAKELGIAAQLTSLPRVSHADLPALLRACDVAVAPGLAPEPLGRAVVEALAVGLPVVAHPSATMQELLLGGEAGMLASAAPMARFADAVAKLLREPAARTALGERARLAALERHDIERAIVDTEALYESLSAARRDRRAPQRRKAAA